MKGTNTLRRSRLWYLSVFAACVLSACLTNRVEWNEVTHCIISRNKIREIVIRNSSCSYTLKVLNKNNVCLDEPIFNFVSEASASGQKALPQDKPILNWLKQGEVYRLEVYTGMDQPNYSTYWTYK